MAKMILTPHSISMVTFRLVLIGTAATILFIVLQRVDALRGILAALGFTCSLLGSGIAGWFSVRMRDRRCALVAASSLLPLAFWLWMIYEGMYGWYAT
jgi:hypothetical protein